MRKEKKKGMALKNYESFNHGSLHNLHGCTCRKPSMAEMLPREGMITGGEVMPVDMIYFTLWSLITMSGD